MKQTMVYKKSTKGTHVFEATDQGEDTSEQVVVPTLYIKRHAFDGDVPKVIEITIEVME